MWEKFKELSAMKIVPCLSHENLKCQQKGEKYQKYVIKGDDDDKKIEKCVY